MVPMVSKICCFILQANNVINYQWQIRWWTGGRVPPSFSPGNFWWSTVKREGRKSILFLFLFSIFESTEICLWSTKNEISTGKRHFTPKKKPGKVILPPLKNLKNIPLTPLLTLHNWQKWKNTFLTWHCHEIYREEAVDLKTSNDIVKIMTF